MPFLRNNFGGIDVAEFNEKDKTWIVKIPKIFSFINNPEEALNTIYSIVSISKLSGNINIFIDHSEMCETDMGASALLDLVIINFRNEWRAKGKQFSLRGLTPKDLRMATVLICTGLTKSLKVRTLKPAPGVEGRFVKFPLFKGTKAAKKLLPSDQEKVATKLANHLNSCLNVAGGYSLTDEGKAQIVKWAGEVIANAEEHSGQKEWYAIGYMEPVESQTEYAGPAPGLVGEYNLAVFGFGRTIYESLRLASTPKDTQEQIFELAKSHQGFFSSLKKYSVEDLYTLYALQDGVSRFSLAPGQSSRGKGTVEWIEAFQKLGKSEDPEKLPEMSLISGSSRIYFSDAYHLERKEVKGGSRMIIAFNKNNNLAEKPDSKHVHSLAGKLPGTLLTFRFYIDSRYLDKLHAEHSQRKQSERPSDKSG